MKLSHKIALVIGFSFPMYGYAIIGKEWFDLCTQVFIMTILALYLYTVINEKDYPYASMIGVMMLSVFYAMCKQLLGIGTEYVWADYLMWFLIPSLIIGILIYDLFKALKNDSK